MDAGVKVTPEIQWIGLPATRRHQQGNLDGVCLLTLSSLAYADCNDSVDCASGWRIKGHMTGCEYINIITCLQQKFELLLLEGKHDIPTGKENKKK